MMRTLLMIVTASFAVSLHAQSITTRVVENEYLRMTVPDSWRLELAGGKERETQMSLWIEEPGTRQQVSLFAYWDGLNPKDWMDQAESSYSIGPRTYFILETERGRKMQLIVQGERFIVSAKVSLGMNPTDLAILLSVLNSLEAK